MHSRVALRPGMLHNGSGIACAMATELVKGRQMPLTMRPKYVHSQ